MARTKGVEITKTLLDGKAFQKVLDHARKTNPWLLVVGRIGVHSPRTRPASAATPRTCCAPPLRHPADDPPRVPRARREGRGEHPLDAGGRGAHEARAAAGAGHRPHRRSSASRSRRATASSPATCSTRPWTASCRSAPQTATRARRGRRPRAREVAADLDLPEVRRLRLGGQRRSMLGLRQHGLRGRHRPRWSSRSWRWRAALQEETDLRRPQAHLDARRQAGALDHEGRLPAPAHEGARREDARA